MADANIAMLLLQPVLLFIFAIIIWSVQSWFVIYFARRYVYPPLYKNRLTEWFVAEVSIVIHEASHFFTAVFTGSTVDLRQSYVSPTSGRIAAARSESIGGWLSNIVAAVAPSFLPPVLFAVMFFLLAQQPVAFDNMFTYQKTTEDLITAFSSGLGVLSLNLSNMMAFFSEPSLLIIIFLYLIIVCTIAAGPSEGDWLSTLELFISPVPAISLFVAFLFFSIAFAQFNIGFLVPFTLLLLFNFLIVVAGVVLASIFALWLKLVYSRGILAGVAVLLILSLVYYLLILYGPMVSIW